MVGLAAAGVLGDDDAGMVSRTSPERRMGRDWISAAPTVPWVAEVAMPVRSSSRPWTSMEVARGLTVRAMRRGAAGSGVRVRGSSLGSKSGLEKRRR